MRLKNKIGIVTAAASGMGRAGAVRFAREGAAVGVVDIDRAGVEAVVAEIAAAGGRAHPIVADLTRDEDSRHIVKETAKTFGGLDFIWNHVVSVICLLLSIGGGLLAWQNWNSVGANLEDESSSPETRKRFMSILGMLTGALFTAVIFAQWLPTLVGVPCEK